MLIGVGVQLGKSGGKPNFATLPEQGGGETPPTTSYYLSLNGNIKLPSMTFTEIVMDFKPYQPSSGAQYYCDFRDATNTTHYLYANGVNDTYNGFSSLYVDSTLKSNNIGSIPRNTRNTTRLVNSTTLTRIGTIGARNDNLSSMRMDVYNIKLYNGTTLVAHYDFTKGNAQDQVGTNHATVTGGTFVQV